MKGNKTKNDKQTKHHQTNVKTLSLCKVNQKQQVAIKKSLKLQEVPVGEGCPVLAQQARPQSVHLHVQQHAHPSGQSIPSN